MAKGDVRWGSVSAISIVWDDQASVLCFATDITDRKQLEEKVAEGERLLRHLVEAANDIIFITDEKGLFTYVNPSGLRISGYSEEEVIGKHFTELIVPEYRESTETFYKKQFAERIPNTYYEYLHHHEARGKALAWSTGAVTYEGRQSSRIPIYLQRYNRPS